MGKTEVSQVPGEPFRYMCPALDPGGSLGPYLNGQSAIAFRFSDTVGPTGTYFRGSITRPTYPLSTLYVVSHLTPHKFAFRLRVRL